MTAILILLSACSGSHRMNSDRTMELAQFLSDRLASHNKLPSSLQEVKSELAERNPNITESDGQYTWYASQDSSGVRTVHVELRTLDGAAYRSAAQVER